MIDVAVAIAPLILLTLFGAFLRRIGFLDEARRRALESFVYFILVPPLIANTVVQVDLDLRIVLPLVPIVLLPLGLNIALMTLLRRMPRRQRPEWLEGPGFASSAMSVSRNNLFVVLAASQALLDVEGAALAALSAAIFMPVANAYGVLVCHRYATAAPPTGIWKTLGALASNPFIFGTIGGVFLNVTGIGLPGPIGPAVSLLSDSALGVALVMVGGGLRLPAVLAAPMGIAVTSVMKLLLQPLAAFALCLLLDLPVATTLAATFYHAGPTAPGAYILARQLGADAEYMAAMITSQTILAAVTMPALFLALLWVLGLDAPT